jgi:hypothetical protein
MLVKRKLTSYSNSPLGRELYMLSIGPCINNQACDWTIHCPYVPRSLWRGRCNYIQWHVFQTSKLYQVRVHHCASAIYFCKHLSFLVWKLCRWVRGSSSGRRWNDTEERMSVVVRVRFSASLSSRRLAENSCNILERNGEERCNTRFLSLSSGQDRGHLTNSSNSA